MATAKKLPSGRWRCRATWVDNGFQKSKSFTADSKDEAEYMASDFLLTRKRSESPDTWTLGDCIDNYIEIKRRTLSPATIQGYKKIRRQNFQRIMNVPVVRITQGMMENAVKEELEKKPQKRKAPAMSVKSVKNAYSLVQAALRRFYPGVVYFIDFPKKARRIRNLPLPAAIYEAVRGTDIELPVLLAMWLSFTESEIRGLTKSGSIDGDFITIRGVVVRVDNADLRKDMAKTETRNRRHRMPGRIKELIEQVDGDAICPMLPNTLLRKFQRALKAAGLPPMTFHDLRHVNASLMAMLHIPDVYAQERGGWKTDAIMKTVYTETFSEERKRVDDLIDGYFEENLGL